MPTDDEFVEKLDRRNEDVYKAYSILEDIFKTDFRRTSISEIIDGEKIQVKPDNILIENRDESISIDTELLDKRFQALCTLKPWSYQRETIIKILELEQKGYNNDIISNGWQISLPIGSGKSLCMEYIAIFHPDVPPHPIIISGNATSIGENEQIPFYSYPFYYERCAYEKDKEPAIMVYKNYTPRRITIILTHEQLIDQMRDYFYSDFPDIVMEVIPGVPYNPKDQRVKIGFVRREEMKTKQIDPSLFDILVVRADVVNISRLVELSFQQPFARVFIDDYTAMSDLNRMRQILTPSFIPVSGQGNERDLSRVPSSYYSMKNVPIDKITLVGDPEKTYEGVFRSNIVTGELMGCASDMDVYKFVEYIDGMCSRNKLLQAQSIDNIFDDLKDGRTLEDYIRYGFFIQNFDLLRSKLYQLRNDFESGRVKESLIPNFSKWIRDPKDKRFKDIITSNPSTTIDKDQVNLLVNCKCLICASEPEVHKGFGIIAGCCGAFICSHCISQASTNMIINSDTNERMESDDYYCCCCRAKSPNYYFNSTRESPTTPLYSYLIAIDNFEVEHRSGVLPIDYYFHMIEGGFKILPEKRLGLPINLYNDIKSGHIEPNVFEKGIEPVIRKIKPVDIIGSQIVKALTEVFIDMKIQPEYGTNIIFYRVKPEIRLGLNMEFQLIRRERNHPLLKVHPMFVDSLDQVIGLHINVLGIVAWKEDEDRFQRHQLLGRIMRCSSFKNRLNFYISLNDKAYI